MKCVKATKTGKYQTEGEIVRLEDSDAQARVSGGHWIFVPKSEWKKISRKQTPDTDVAVEENKTENKNKK